MLCDNTIVVRSSLNQSSFELKNKYLFNKKSNLALFKSAITAHFAPLNFLEVVKV